MSEEKVLAEKREETFEEETFEEEIARKVAEKRAELKNKQEGGGFSINPKAMEELSKTINSLVKVPFKKGQTRTVVKNIYNQLVSAAILHGCTASKIGGEKVLKMCYNIECKECKK